jgi:hypothetical protein
VGEASTAVFQFSSFSSSRAAGSEPGTKRLCVACNTIPRGKSMKK